MRKIILAAALLLVGCGNAPPEMYVAAPAPVVMAESDVADGYSKSSPAPAPASENPSALSFLAYRYGYSFALPAKSVSPTMQSHVATCAAAGANLCQVLNSSTNQNSDTNVYANLSLRAEPKWLETFSAQMISSVEEAKGEVRGSNVSAEDLTRQILDTDARLKAQLTLRDRLQKLLETRDAKLPDLLALERELARVQGQIESATTTLKVLRKRVSMSVVDIDYQSQSVAVSRSAFAPIGTALKDFFRTLSYGLASVIEFFAAVLPWLLLVILPGLWLLRWFWRRRKKA